MTISTIIKRLEEEQDKISNLPLDSRLTEAYRHIEQRLTGALLLMYRLRDAAPLTGSHEIPHS